MTAVKLASTMSLPAALAATAWFGHVPAQAAPASPVPDFYQHQAWLPATMGNAKVPAGRNGWENWQAADYVANGALNAALNEAAENPKERLLLVRVDRRCALPVDPIQDLHWGHSVREPVRQRRHHDGPANGWTPPRAPCWPR